MHRSISSGSADQGGQAVFLLVQLHAYAHLHIPQAGIERQTGLGLIADGMTEFDGMVGKLLKKLQAPTNAGVSSTPS